MPTISNDELPAHYWRDLLRQLPVTILIIDHAGTIKFINYTVSPLKISDVVGKTIYDYISPEEQSIARDALKQAISTGKQASYELHAIGEHGVTSCYLARVLPVANANNDELVMATLDISEHRRIRERNEQLSYFLDHLPAVAWIKDEQMRYVYVNKAYEESKGLKSGECIGKTTSDIWPADIASGFDTVNREVLASGNSSRMLETTRSGDMTQHWLVTRFPIPVPTSPHKFIAGVALDITESKRAERERHALDQKLFETQKLESLGVLAGGVAHDFNNLLAIILGNINIARWNADRGLPLEPQLETIESIAMQAASICRQMLTYAGKKAVEVSPVDIVRAMADVKDLVRSTAGAAISVTESYAPELPLVHGDDVQLRQVFLNLLMNAMEAIGDKAGAVHISAGVTTLQTGDVTTLDLAPAPENLPGVYVFISVRDNGCGMSPQIKAKIFDPFFSTKFTGRGLGLAAVQGILRNHKGGIRVQSEAGAGTTFTLYLPKDSAAK